MLQVNNDTITLLGTRGARLFRMEELVNEYEPAQEFAPGDSLDFLCTQEVKKVSSASVANAIYLAWYNGQSDFNKMMIRMHY